MKILYPLRGGPGTSLSSGTGNSAHADYVNGWEPAALELRVRECLRKDVKCSNNLPGDVNIQRTLGNTIPPPPVYNPDPTESPSSSIFF